MGRFARYTWLAGMKRGDVIVCAMSGDYDKPRPAVVIQSDLFNETRASISLYFEHDSARNFMLVIFHTKVNDSDLAAHTSRMLESRYDQPGKKGLVVLCESVRITGLSFQGIFAAGKRMHHAGFRENGRLAIVAKSTVAFGLAKTYEMAAEVANLDETRVVRSNQLDDVMQWLDVSDISKDIRLKISQREEENSIEPVAMHRR